MTKVFVIDDSLSVRNGFKNIIADLDNIVLIGEANNPVDAFDIFKKVGLPDLFILDIEMPKMDGLSFLEQINRQRPTPVIICSNLIQANPHILIEALRLGAVDIIEKPKHNLNAFFITYKEELSQKIYALTHSKISYHSPQLIQRVNKIDTDTKTASNSPATKVVVIGSSTGGIQVLEEIIQHLNFPHSAIIIVQHIPKGFSAPLAKRLNTLHSKSVVKEGVNNEMICNNTVYLAPAGLHVEVIKKGLTYHLQLNNFEKVNSHKPSVNVLFYSVAKTFKSHAMGFILTGMGGDGADGLYTMRKAGAKTYSQNEMTSSVYGMPRVAYEMGASKKEVSIFEITQLINRFKELNKGE